MKLCIACLFFAALLHYGLSDVSLEGSNVYGIQGGSVPGRSTYLTCKIVGGPTAFPRSWLLPDNTIFSMDDRIFVQNLAGRFSYVNRSSDEMTMKVEPVLLSDAGDYNCQLLGGSKDAKAISSLSVNKFPDVRATMSDEEIFEDRAATLATCHAELSKPAPEIWFEDATGEKVKSLSAPAVMSAGDDAELVNVSLALTRIFSRDQHDTAYTCKVRHRDYDEDYSLPLAANVHVKYSPTVTLQSSRAGRTDVLLEGSFLADVCRADGNPKPTLTWSFRPNNESAPPELPANFVVAHLAEGAKLSSDGVAARDGVNNGTFTCTADNRIGDPVSVSFRLAVYRAPTTPAPPTTTPEPQTIPLPEPQVADAAVIGGVVAVAVFVLIITVILLLRYFLSHKGEYYTNEVKALEEAGGGSVEEESDDDDDDDGLPTTEADLLGQHKRSEHFM